MRRRSRAPASRFGRGPSGGAVAPGAGPSRMYGSVCGSPPNKRMQLTVASGLRNVGYVQAEQSPQLMRDPLAGQHHRSLTFENVFEPETRAKRA